MSKMTLQCFDNGTLTLNTMTPSMRCEIATFNIGEKPQRFDNASEYRQYVANRIVRRLGLEHKSVYAVASEFVGSLPIACHFSGVAGCLDVIVVLVDAIDTDERSYSVVRLWQTADQSLALSRDAQGVEADEAMATVFHLID